MLKSTLVIFLACLATAVCAQKQANIWHFGNKGGLDFNQSPPAPISGSSMNTQEGCASIADFYGNLLFYTNGVKIWNKKHAVMMNGDSLHGHSTSTQSAIIVPKPYSKTNYYVFTIGSWFSGKNKGAYYNEIDMSKNAGLGEVVTKNQFFFNGGGNYTYETLGATSHANGRDFWVCVLDKNSIIRAFLVTPSGVSKTSVNSQFTNLYSNVSSSGYMKFSSNNKLMAFGGWNTVYKLNLLKFNDKTGKFSNPIIISNLQTYCQEFSPNSEFLYTSNGEQFNVSTFDSATIVNSKFKFMPSLWQYALQLGPDGKIYIANNSDSLDVILHPEWQGVSCGYEKKKVPISGRSRFGLPTFLQTFVMPYTTAKGSCLGDSSTFEVTKIIDTDSVKWFFGDSSFAFSNFITSPPPNKTFKIRHLYKKPGNYKVLSILYYNGYVDSVYHDVSVREYLGTGKFLGDDVAICRGDSVVLKSNNWAFENYKWSSGDSSQKITVSNTGKYWARLYPEYKCYYSDTIEVSHFENDEIPNKLNLGRDIILCPNFKIELTADEKFQRYTWNTGDTISKIEVTDTGEYVLTGYNHNRCFSRDTIHISIYPGAYPNLGRDSFYCLAPDKKIRLGDFDVAFDKYLWENGSTDPFQLVSEAGTYILEVQNEFGCKGKDTVSIGVVSTRPNIAITGKTFYCDSIPLLSKINAINLGDSANYLWSTGDNQTTIYVSDTGWHVLKATNACGYDTDSIKITIERSPIIKFPNGAFQIICDTIDLKVKPILKNKIENLFWSTGDTTHELSILKPGKYTLIAKNSCGTDTQSVEYHLKRTPTYKSLPDTTICSPVDLTYQIVNIDTSMTYEWKQDGSIVSTNHTFKTSQGGTFSLNMENYCGNHLDTFIIRSLTKPLINLGPDIDRCDSVIGQLKAGKSMNNEIYLWSTGDTDSVIELQNEGVYWVKATNKCGADSDSLEVRLHYHSIPSQLRDTVICDSASIKINATIKGKHNSYKWSNGVLLATNIITTNGVQSIRITNKCLDSTYSFRTTFLKSPKKTLLPEFVYCDESELTTLKVGFNHNKETYLWSTGDTTNSIMAMNPETYWVRISNLCSQITDTTRIRVSESPQINLGNDTSLCGDFSLELNAGNPNHQYLWKPFNETTQIIQATKQKRYAVVVTNEDGCKGYGDYEIFDSCKTTFFIPTAFSPNDDGLNDMFRPVFYTNVGHYRLKVFNRWGEQIYKSEDLTQAWNGYYHGRRCQQGVYLVLIEYYNYELKKIERLSLPISLIY